MYRSSGMGMHDVMPDFIVIAQTNVIQIFIYCLLTMFSNLIVLGLSNRLFAIVCRCLGKSIYMGWSNEKIATQKLRQSKFNNYSR